VIVTGAFVYQPPGREGASATAAGFSIALGVVNDDGSPYFTKGSVADRLNADVVLSYPQLPAPNDTILLSLANVTTGPNGYVALTATFNEIINFVPPAGWMPAAIVISIDYVAARIITAAAPAVADSGIVKPQVGHR
jgi:hypothetical protein